MSLLGTAMDWVSSEPPLQLDNDLHGRYPDLLYASPQRQSGCTT